MGYTRERLALLQRASRGLTRARLLGRLAQLAPGAPAVPCVC